MSNREPTVPPQNLPAEERLRELGIGWERPPEWGYMSPAQREEYRAWELGIGDERLWRPQPPLVMHVEPRVVAHVVAPRARERRSTRRTRSSASSANPDDPAPPRGRLSHDLSGSPA